MQAHSQPRRQSLDQSPFPTPVQNETMARSRQYTEQLSALKARLLIFLYQHPVDNSDKILDVIENAESPGEIRLLMEYILDRVDRRAGPAGNAAAA